MAGERGGLQNAELGLGMPREEGEAGTHVQDKLCSHRLVVADCVLHVAAVAVLGHLQPVALLSGGAATSTRGLDFPQDTVCPGRLPLLGTVLGRHSPSVRGSGSRHSPQPRLQALFPDSFI